jgi:hypothetical protein
MWQYIVRILLTAAVVGAVSEIAKRNTLWLPRWPRCLSRHCSLVWLYLDTGDTQRVADLSQVFFGSFFPLYRCLYCCRFFCDGVELRYALASHAWFTAAAYFGIIWCWRN